MPRAIPKLAVLPRAVGALAAGAHPLELVGADMLVVCLALVAVFNLRWYFPDGNSALFATEHYELPLALALGFAWLGGRSKVRAARSDSLRPLRLVAWFSLIIYLHFNLKLWAQLVNPVRWDDAFMAVDDTYWPALAPFHSSYPLWDWLVTLWPNAYHDVFVGMFMTSLVAHATLDRSVDGLSKVATALALVLALGGCAYMVAPAWGPFIFEAGTNPAATAIQKQMALFHIHFVATAGAAYQGSNFVMALGAMPSLHAGHAFVLLYYAWRRLPWLGYVYVLPFLFLVTEAVMAKWHYAIDLPAGLLIAGASIWLSDFLHRRRPKETQ